MSDRQAKNIMHKSSRIFSWVMGLNILLCLNKELEYKIFTILSEWIKCISTNLKLLKGEQKEGKLCVKGKTQSVCSVFHIK